MYKKLKLFLQMNFEVNYCISFLLTNAIREKFALAK